MNSPQSYGISIDAHSSYSLQEEEFAILGYTVFNDVLKPSSLKEIKDSVHRLYALQSADYDYQLAEIDEEDLLRCPLQYDKLFLDLATNAQILDFVRKMLDQPANLHLQNAIINQPNKKHHQTSWHRDLPYQQYTVSKPIAISCLYCIDRFDENTGGTFVLPYSHNLESPPSVEFIKKNEVQIKAEAGSVIAFNSLLLHRAGDNLASQPRIGINNVYTVPLLKQQIDIPKLTFDYQIEDSAAKELLGFAHATPENVAQFRSKRRAKVDGGIKNN